jgi:DNA-binding response OmpR family regulator
MSPGRPAPVIVLSGRTGAQDKIGALDAGADEYVTKPFAMDELLARLRSVLRRGEAVRPGGAAAPADRARHGLPVPAMTACLIFARGIAVCQALSQHGPAGPEGKP